MPLFAESDYHPTGKLALEFEYDYFGRGTMPRHSFRDGNHQRLQYMASDIALGLAVLLAAKKETVFEIE